MERCASPSRRRALKALGATLALPLLFSPHYRNQKRRRTPVIPFRRWRERDFTMNHHLAG